jgi:hypothetical protein
VQRWRRQTAIAYDKDLDNARKEKLSHEKRRGIEETAWHEDRMYSEQIHQLHTEYLSEVADRLIVMAPSLSDDGSGKRAMRHTAII